MHATIPDFQGLKATILSIFHTISADNFREKKNQLMALRGEMAGLILDRGQRQEINSLIDDCFVAINCLRDQEQQQFEDAAQLNFKRLSPLVEKALEEARHAEDKRQTWDFCISVQNEFRGIQLKQEDREALYAILQEAFGVLKSNREAQDRLFVKEAKDNFNHLKSLVDTVFERAQHSMEFKKTREALKRVQAAFKGIKMAAEDRQALYSKLQNAFDTLSRRQDEYYVAKKDKIELHINYQLSDLELRIEDIRKEIDRDRQRIQELRDASENILPRDTPADPSHDIRNQIQVLQASIARKEAMVDELSEQQARVLQKKEKWEGLE